MIIRKPIKFNHPLTDEELPLYKNYNCDYYRICLDKASTENWRNFLCISCPVFKSYRKAREKIDGEFRRNSSNY